MNQVVPQRERHLISGSAIQPRILRTATWNCHGVVSVDSIGSVGEFFERKMDSELEMAGPNG
jgi:hypothetical protein